MRDLASDPLTDIGQTLLDRVPSMMAYFDAELRCRYANSPYKAQAGLQPTETLGRTMPEILGTEVFARRKAHVARALSGERQSFEHVLGEGAARRHLLINYVPDGEPGHVRGFVVQITDITAQRFAEEALTISETRFRTLAESSPLGVYYTDAAGRRTYVNSRWREIYGLPGTQGLGNGWMRALHEEDRDGVVHAWEEMAAHGRELELTFRIRQGGYGNVRILRTRTRPVRNDGGIVTGFVGALEDITDRREQEERLKSSEEFLDRSGRIARIGGWEVDLRTKSVRWSEQTRRICEVDDDYEPPFLGGSHLYPPEAWERVSAALDEAMRSGRSWDLELPFITTKGRHLWVRVFGEAEMEDGVPVRLMGVMQDITEQHRQRQVFQEEQVLRRASERHAAELDRLLQERSEMLDVMAHEVRQPLNNASAALQGAASVMEEHHEQVAAHRLLRAQAVLSQVMASIDNTLAVASLLARPDPLLLADTDIDTLVSVSIADVCTADRSRIRVAYDASARTAPMDMSLMRLAVRNLLSNALRYSPADSIVTVRIADSDDPLGLLIDVTNEGGPIPAPRLARLFERGSERPPGDMAPSQGLGLGLYIVRRVMELHAGTAELLTNEAGCVTFRLFVGPALD